MQHLDGETLAVRLERGALPLDVALEIGAQIAEALAAAHRRGIVHRDLKPGNIMLTRTGARLLDFGLAKQTGAALGATAQDALTIGAPVTAARSIVGTLQYMAPEQLEGREVDPRTDLFALGAVLYEMVTGRRAFAGDSFAGVAAAVLTSQPPPVRSLVPLTPPVLSRIVERCLAKNPDDRWQSADDLAFVLRRLGPDAAERPATPRSRLRLQTALALAMTAAGAAIALALYLRPSASSGGAPELRMSIVPPPGHSFTTDVADYNPEFSLSPDGSNLAFTTMNEDGERQLWVRSLSDIAARPLAGTTGARMPFWSDRGRSTGRPAVAGRHKARVLGRRPPSASCVGCSAVPASPRWRSSRRAGRSTPRTPLCARAPSS